MEADVAHDGVIAQDAKQVIGSKRCKQDTWLMMDQIQALWQWRETIPEAIVKSGTAMTYDVSMDVKLLYKMVEDAKKHYNDRGLLGDGNVYYNVIGFGHVGDGVSVYNGCIY